MATATLAPATTRTSGDGTLYRRWIAACTAGELIGIGTATGSALAVSTMIGEPASTIARLIVLAIFATVGIVEGGALAYLEWRVLRARLPRLRAAEWMAPTIAVATTGWLVGMTPSLFLASVPEPGSPVPEPPLLLVLAVAAAAGGLAGLFFGTAQWVVLRRHAGRAHTWIWIHVPAWALAMAAIFLGASVPSDAWPAWAIGVAGVAGGVLGGLLLGAVTGVVARRLVPLAQPRRISADSPLSRA